MKVLVTGGAGFIGSHVVDEYLRRDYEVVVVDNLVTGSMSNLNPRAKFYKVDIRSHYLAEIFDREMPDLVNHHAAQMNVRRSLNEPIFDADVNILGSLNVIENARRHRVGQVIYISSGGAVYGEPEYLPCDENHPVDPICPYGASKHTIEHYLYMYAENYGLNYAVLRYPNVYGPRQDPKGEAGVVAIFAQQMLSGEQTVINGDGDQQRDFLYVSDCAHANLLLSENPQANGIYNLGTGTGTSINTIFTIVKNLTGYRRTPYYGPAILGETRRIYLDASKAQRELGWQVETELLEGMAQTVAYFQERSTERVV